MKKIILLAHDSSSIPGVTGTLEIFHIANILSNIQNPGTEPLFSCTVVSTQKTVHTLCDGLTVEFGKSIVPYEQADAVVMTGFLYRTIDDLLEKVGRSKPAVNWIVRQHHQGAVIAASCSGTVLLAETGLLNGRSATTSWWLEQFFRKRYPAVDIQIERLVVESGRLLSAGAVTSYANLILHLIEKFADKILAHACAKMMLIDINKSQAPYMILQSILDHSDNLMSKAQFWINGRLQKNIDMRELSDHLAISYRTLIRRFKTVTGDTPTQYVQKSRIESAKHLLETTDIGIETIMERVGYSDPSAFSLLFKRLTRLTPREYRHRFHPDSGKNNSQ